MRYVRLMLVVAVAALFVGSRSEEGDAFPGLGGIVVFSTEGMGPAHDVSAVPYGPGVSCTSADILTAPAGPAGPCMPRALPAPPGPVPAGVTGTVADLGLNAVAGPFTDDLDGLSFGETLNVVTLDIDFSVDPSPANGGVTVGAPVGGPCLAFPVNVTSESALMEAHGDVFSWSSTFAGPCNTLMSDEAASGLIAPNPLAPGVPPLDNVDALAETTMMAGPCTLIAGTMPSDCAAYTVAAGSPVLGAIPPDPLTLSAATGGTILAQPGTPAAPPVLPTGCAAGGLPCPAVPFPILGLGPMDDIDALCWFDVMGPGVPDAPIGALGPGSIGDIYLFSLTPASPSAAGLGGAAAIIRAGGPVPLPGVVIPAPTMGLLPTDNVDGIICHDNDSDFEGVPDFLDVCDGIPDPGQMDTDADLVGDACDNCPTVANAGQVNVDLDASGDLCDTEGPSGNTNGLGGADDCTDGVDNDGDGAPDGPAEPTCAPDTDGDGVPDATDNCPTVPNPGQGDGDGDTVGDACDNCPTVSNTGQANSDGDAWGDACDNCPTFSTPWSVPTGDTDCDGFPDTVNSGSRGRESFIGTDATDRCADTTMPNDETAPGVSPWPSDFNDTRATNLTDVVLFGAWFNQIGPNPPNLSYNPRFDLNASNSVNLSDVVAIGPFFNRSCTP